MAFENARERFKKAIGVLVDEKGPIKERLLIAYASQLSQVDHLHDLPAALADQFDELRYMLSDAEMPYGYGEHTAKKLHEMTDDEATELARSIYSIFLKLYELEPQESGVLGRQ